MSGHPIMTTQTPTSSNSTDTDFPALVRSETPTNRLKPFEVLPAYHPTKVTEVFDIPFDQRRSQNENTHVSGKHQDAYNRRCYEIAKEVGVEVNLSRSKSNTLTIVLTGHPNKVQQAKQQLIAELQQPDCLKIKIPVEFFGFVIGKGGRRLRELERNTLTRIVIPPNHSNDQSTVTITGPKQGVLEAERWIRETVEQQSRQAFERLDIPKVYHPFICGPNNSRIDELRKQTDTKIHVPPRSSVDTVIIVSGMRDGVTHAVAAMRTIHEQALKYRTMPVSVKKTQHHLVFGRRGCGLADILSQTGVSVELPSDTSSDEVILRGRPEDLGRALSMVFERAESSTTAVVHAPMRFHRLLIGKRGATLAELREGYEKVNVSFADDEDNIYLDGPPAEVEVIAERLRTRVSKLQATLHMDAIKVDPKYFRHIIGRQGAMILRLCGDKVQIKLPSAERNGNTAPPDEIVIEGDPIAVQKAKSEIQRIVEKLESEKCKDMIIEPRVQQLLCTGYRATPPPIRAIYDSFPKVSFIWPPSQQNKIGRIEDPSRSIVQLRGDRQQVDAAAERLIKLIKQIKLDNQSCCQEEVVSVNPKYHGHLIGRQGVNIARFSERHNVDVLFPDRFESDPDLAMKIHILGSKSAVLDARNELESIIKTMEEEIEMTVPVDPTLLYDFQSYRHMFSYPELDAVHVNLPKTLDASNGTTDKVEIKLIGEKSTVQAASDVLHSIFRDIECQTTKRFPLNDPGHFIALDRMRPHLRDLERTHCVFIKLHRNDIDSTAAPRGESSIGPSGWLYIKGNPERVESCYAKEITPMLPLEEEFPVSKEFHGSLLAVPVVGRSDEVVGTPQIPRRKGLSNNPSDQATTGKSGASDVLCSKVAEIRQKHGVFVHVPPLAEDRNSVTLRGTASQLIAAKAELQDWLSQCERMKADRIARSYESTIVVPTRFLPDLRAQRSGIIAKHKVAMRLLPQSNRSPAPLMNGHSGKSEVTDAELTNLACLDPVSDAGSPQNGVNDVCEKMSLIVLRGYEQNVLAAKKQLDDVIAKLNSKITESVYIPSKTHSYLIGSRGSAIQKVMQDYNVRIDFPNRFGQESDSNTVYVTGDQADVDHACDFLVERANDLIYRLDREQRQTDCREAILPTSQKLV